MWSMYIEDAARHRRPSRFFRVGSTEEGAVEARRFGFWRIFGKAMRQFVSGISPSADFPQNASYQHHSNRFKAPTARKRPNTRTFRSF